MFNKPITKRRNIIKLRCRVFVRKWTQQENSAFELGFLIAILAPILISLPRHSQHHFWSVFIYFTARRTRCNNNLNRVMCSFLCLQPIFFCIILPHLFTSLLSYTPYSSNDFFLVEFLLPLSLIILFISFLSSFHLCDVLNHSFLSWSYLFNVVNLRKNESSYFFHFHSFQICFFII